MKCSAVELDEKRASWRADKQKAESRKQAEGKRQVNEIKIKTETKRDNYERAEGIRQLARLLARLLRTVKSKLHLSIGGQRTQNHTILYLPSLSL